MQRYLYLVITTATLSLFPPLSPLTAQPHCFMRGSNGQTIDLGSLCGNSVSPPTETNRKKVIQIPIKRRLNGIPTIDVTFNGDKTFEMLFDTGASMITITTEMADAIGVKPERSAYSQTAGGVVPVGLGMVETVSAQGLTLKNVPVSINPSHSLTLGLLGQTFFREYDLTIKEKVIELHPRP
jgi:aspartyl protease family protein